MFSIIIHLIQTTRKQSILHFPYLTIIELHINIFDDAAKIQYFFCIHNTELI